MLRLHPDGSSHQDRAVVHYPDTGIALALTTDLVEGSIVRSFVAFDDLSESGTFGDPSLATVEKGGRFLAISAEALAAFLADFRDLADTGAAARNKLRVGVIGLGYFGERHAKIYHRLPYVDLVAVCDRDVERAERIAGEPAPIRMPISAACFRARTSTRSASVFPTAMHTEPAVAAAEAGKAILLEKPLAHDAAHAKIIVDAVERNGVRFMVGHILRFDPRYVQVHEASRPEKLGTPIHLKAKRNGIRSVAARVGRNASILFYMGVHDIDAMQWVARSRIARVYAQKIERLGNGNEDALYAVVNFENGAIGSLDYSWAWPDGLMNGYKAVLEIVGTQVGRLPRLQRPGLL